MAFPIRVADIMSSPVETTTPDTAAADAAAICHERSIGSLVVLDDQEVVGIVTSSDFVRLLGEASDPETRTLEEFMSTDVVTTDASTTVLDAVLTMTRRNVARLVVFDDDELVGLVSTDDLARHVPQVFQRRQFDRPVIEERPYRFHRETAYEETDWEFESIGLDAEHVSVGDRVEFTKTISEQDVRTFAAATGDTNRIHLDEAFASQTRFGRRIAHGTLVGSLISAALARLPGLTIYLSQDLSFLEPVDIGDRVTGVCEVVEDLGRDKYQLTTDVVDRDDERLIEGQAVVLIDELPTPETVSAEAIPSAR